VHATAVLYPIFVVASLAVSVWRARLARTLDIHKPGAGAARGRSGGRVVGASGAR